MRSCGSVSLLESVQCMTNSTHVATSSCSPAGVNGDHMMLLTGPSCPWRTTGCATVRAPMSSIFHIRPVQSSEHEAILVRLGLHLT